MMIRVPWPGPAVNPGPRGGGLTWPRGVVMFRPRGDGAVAQLGERVVRNDEVSGSIPLSSTTPAPSSYRPIPCRTSVIPVMAICTPMHSSRKADSRAKVVRAEGPSIPAIRSAER
jgi:hypothetical protein